MKKVLLLAAFGVAGLMSAKGVQNDVFNLQNVTVNGSQYTLVAIIPPHDWLEVETWCGKVFYLDNNDYSNIEEVGADANYFTDQQCGPMP